MIALFCMLMLIMHMANLNLYYLFYKKKYNYLFSLLVSLFLYHNQRKKIEKLAQSINMD